MRRRWVVVHALYLTLVIALLVLNGRYENNGPFWTVMLLTLPLSPFAYMCSILGGLLTPAPISLAIELALFSGAAAVNVHIVRASVRSRRRRHGSQFGSDQR
jgi:hypothetical protein